MWDARDHIEVRCYGSGLLQLSHPTLEPASFLVFVTPTSSPNFLGNYFLWWLSHFVLLLLKLSTSQSVRYFVTIFLKNEKSI